MTRDKIEVQRALTPTLCRALAMYENDKLLDTRVVENMVSIQELRTELVQLTKRVEEAEQLLQQARTEQTSFEAMFWPI
jgi:hypothetical protein